MKIADILLIVTFLIFPRTLTAESAAVHEWDVPAPLKDQLSLKASDIPSFPNHDSTLDRFENWAKNKTFFGYECSLKLYFDGGDFTRDFQSSEKITTDNLVAEYVCPTADGIKRLGPRYKWLNGRITARSHNSIENGRLCNVDYEYYLPSGELQTYSNYPSTCSSDIANQYYDRNGDLVGVMILFPSGKMRVWNGKRIERELFFDKVCYLEYQGSCPIQG